MKPSDDKLHVRLSRDMVKQLDSFVTRGLFASRNEIIREAIRHILLKYQEAGKK